MSVCVFDHYYSSDSRLVQFFPFVVLSRKIDDKTADKPENENTNVLELIDKLQNNNVDEKDDVLAQLQKKANEYYNKSDFFRAKCLYDIIFQNIDLKDQNLL